MPTFRVLIVNPETLEPVPENHVGEIWIHGPSVARGYWKRPEYTKEMFHATIQKAKAKTTTTLKKKKMKMRGDDNEDEEDTTLHDWLRSGDMGFLHQRQLYITGRLKDLIIIRGRNVSPQDIEQSVRHIIYISIYVSRVLLFIHA